MALKQEIRECWGKFQAAFLIPEVTGAFFAVALTLIGLFQTQNAVSALVGIMWGIIAYAIFRGKTRWWLAIIILVTTGAFLYWINPLVVKFVMTGRDQASSQIPPLKTPEPEYGLIKNGGFDQGYDGLDGWISNERPQRPSFASEDVVGTFVTTKEYVMSVKPEMGYWGAGLVINCKKNQSLMLIFV